MKKVVLFAIFGTFCMLEGCAGTPKLQSSGDVQVLAGNTLPAPGRTDLLAANRPYLIGPFDKLKIEVFGIPELSGKEVQTDASGRISFPLTGTIEASGQTPGELADIIKQRLEAGYVRNPQVTVNLVETVSQVITVDGEVKEPGLYPVIGRMTLMRAVATAKGSTEYAKLDDVVIFRTVGGQRLAALYNLKAIRRGAYADPEVFANDVVVVGDSPGRRLFQKALQSLSILSTPIVVLIQNL
jgi:polysaccharide export outer membrane protein